jgi:hypothetical protein
VRTIRGFEQSAVPILFWNAYWRLPGLSLFSIRMAQPLPITVM